MARRKKRGLPPASSWYIPWKELEEVVEMIRRADGEADLVERAREALRESREEDENS